MRNIVIVLGIIVFIAGALYAYFFRNNSASRETFLPRSSPQTTVSDIPQTSVIAENLDTPWAIAFLPDKSTLVTERPGRVRLVESNGNLQAEPVTTINEVKEIGEGGLLGITLHPNFSTNSYVYLYYTYSGNGGNTLNRVVRMTFKNKQLTNEQIIVDRIPGASNHNGGRIKFGPDGFLYITTGDAQNPSQAQDTSSLAGKILRVKDDGSVPSDNPFGNAVYSYGHRNPQGLAWDSLGRLWATEHGQTAFDEINVINKGENFGWPDIRGDEFKQGMQKPFVHSGNITWAPSGAIVKENKLYFAGLRGQALYSLDISPKVTADIREEERLVMEYFKGEFGRIREVIPGPDNLLYITTSNKDGRGTPAATDDKIISVNPQKL